MNTRPNTDHCEVLIIGAGPAGMAAALAAAASGARITLIDDNPATGGQIWRGGPGAVLPPVAVRQQQALANCANVQVHTGTRVISLAGPQALLLEDAERGWVQTYEVLIVCTGARELLLPFPGWTLPGVTGAGGLQALIKAGLPVKGERIVIAGTGPLLLAAAATARQAGAQVVRIAEQTSLAHVARFSAQLWRWPGKVMQALRLSDPRYRTSSVVVRAEGSGRVETVQINQAGRLVSLACERVACGFGLVPNTALGQLLGCALRSDATSAPALHVDALQATSVSGVYAAGECTGFGGVERALVQGSIAGYAAVGQHSAAQALGAKRARWDVFARQLHQHFALSPTLRALPDAATLVCRCEDVPHAQLSQHGSWTDAKLHSRCGMGACQGRICGAAAQFLYGWSPPAPRPPLSPARLGTLTEVCGHED